MFSDFPQLVPQKICLSCQGCCRFREAESVWRPKLTQVELAAVSSAADRKTLTQALGTDGYLPTVKEKGQNRCTFFHLDSNQCGIYSCRPFECRLYPFLLSKKSGSIVVSVHLSCPYIQESRYSPEFEKYVGVLKSYLSQDEKRQFLKNSSAFLGDYSEHAVEIEELFALELK